LEDRSLFAPFNNTYALFMQPLVLICGVVMLIIQYAGHYATMAVSGPFPLGGHSMIPVIMGVTAGIKFAVFAIVFFILARKIGDSGNSAGRPDIGIWIALMVAYFIVTKLTAMIPPIFLRPDEMQGLRFSAMMSFTSLIVRVAYFPVMVFIAAAAHSVNSCRLSEVWAFLTSRGSKWYLCYALFGLVFALALFAMPLGLETASGVPPRGGVLSIAIVGVAGQLFGILFAIAAYRVLREEKVGRASRD
jgi:hypothetical protein